ncbi:zinc metallopeptidase [Baaleninema simplex]|uniref:zinc metallopeptidase n=1 Tax=Baaleninema simplex TaxID=2862350 RepID=UPI00034B0824|nr:zinc metallopeptidase [Baaleninema simplex]
MPYFHWSYLVLIPGILLMVWAQAQIHNTYRRYAEIPSTLGMTGEEVARAILAKKGIYDVRVEPVGGELTDHYQDPSQCSAHSRGLGGW